MAFAFPVGPKADLAELLYVSALHQTCDEIRHDASIDAKDISCYLISRYGIKITPEAISQSILKVHSHEGKTIDLVELVALLFIPQICKAAASQRGEIVTHKNLEASCPNLIEGVFTMILHDVTDGTHGPQMLTIELVKDILKKYGEFDLANNDHLVKEMFLAASGGKENVVLDKDRFLQALTADISLYNILNEVNLSTIFSDVFGGCDCDYGKDHSVGMGLIPQSASLVRSDSTAEGHLAVDDDEVLIKQNKPPTFRKIVTGQGLDTIAGCYSCKIQIICTWVTFIFAYMGYIYPLVGDLREKVLVDCPEFLALQTSWTPNRIPLACNIGNSLIDWGFIYLSTMLFGIAIIFNASMGFELDSKGWFPQVASTLIFTTLLVAGPIFEGFTRDGSMIYLFLRIVTFIFGSVIVMIRWMRSAQLLFNFWKVLKPTNIYHERDIKKAATKKIAMMQKNALHLSLRELDDRAVIKTYYGSALKHFNESIDEKMEVGGFMWGWRLYFSKDLMQKQGIWISARFLASNYSQMIVSIFVILVCVSATMYLNKHWINPADLGLRLTNDLSMFLTTLADKGIVEEAVNSAIERVLLIVTKMLDILEGSNVLKLDCLAISSYLVTTCKSGTTNGLTDIACSLFAGNLEDVCVPLEFLSQPALVSATVSNTERYLSNNAVFNSTVLREPVMRFISDSVGNNLILMINKWYPIARYMVLTPAIVCSIVAIIASATMATSVIPSFISTILQLRSGVIESFSDKNFPKYREDIIKSTWLMGSMFWGNLIGSILIGLTFGLVVFFSLWQVTSFLAQRLVGLLIGIGFIAAIRELYWQRLQRFMYKGFYRTRPLPANWVSVIDESVNFALTILTVLIRLGKLCTCAVFYAGRIDRPFLASGVGVTPFFIADSYYNYFMADTLAVEAHRHPYIETLGFMYLMKIRHDADFMNRAGVTWRLIFVTALMPWLRKYRVMSMTAEENLPGHDLKFLDERVKYPHDTEKEEIDDIHH